MTVGKYLVKILIKASQAAQNLNDGKQYFLIMKEAESFNRFVLVSRFNYSKLTVKILMA